MRSFLATKRLVCSLTDMITSIGMAMDIHVSGVTRVPIQRIRSNLPAVAIMSVVITEKMVLMLRVINVAAEIDT